MQIHYSPSPLIACPGPDPGGEGRGERAGVRLIQYHLNMSRFEFVPLTEDHFELLHKWHHEPHVSEWWDLINPTLEHVRKDYLKIMSEPHVFSYIAFLDASPIGYIQSYDATHDGDDWWPDAKPGTWGIDLFIGEPDYVGMGLGTQLIVEFSDMLLEQPDATCVIVDPDPENTRAIGAYERAGFEKSGPITTPDGAALLMIKR